MNFFKKVLIQFGVLAFCSSGHVVKCVCLLRTYGLHVYAKACILGMGVVPNPPMGLSLRLLTKQQSLCQITARCGIGSSAKAKIGMLKMLLDLSSSLSDPFSLSTLLISLGSVTCSTLCPFLCSPRLAYFLSIVSLAYHALSGY